MLAALRGYKILLSPLFAGTCRFTPSCADYMADAVRLHGAVVGVGLGLRRLVRCHPFGAWGVDPVPPVESQQPTADSQQFNSTQRSAVGCQLSTAGDAKVR